MILSRVREEARPGDQRTGVVLIALDGPSAGVPTGALLELKLEPGYSYTLHVIGPEDTPVSARRVRADGALGAPVQEPTLTGTWQALENGLLQGRLEVTLCPTALGTCGPICLGIGRLALRSRQHPPRCLRVAFPDYAPTSTWAFGSVEIRRERAARRDTRGARQQPEPSETPAWLSSTAAPA